MVDVRAHHPGEDGRLLHVSYRSTGVVSATTLFLPAAARIDDADDVLDLAALLRNRLFFGELPLVLSWNWLEGESTPPIKLPGLKNLVDRLAAESSKRPDAAAETLAEVTAERNRLDAAVQRVLNWADRMEALAPVTVSGTRLAQTVRRLIDPGTR